MKKYEVLIDGVSVWTSRNGYKQTAINPNLKLQFNKTDEFRITLLPGNPAFDTVSRFLSTVTVTEDDETIFVGRIRSISTTLKGNKTLTCEGPFSFLLDSYTEANNLKETVSLYFQRLIANHNSQIGEGRVFEFRQCVNETCNTKDKFVIDDITTTQAVVSELLNRQRAELHFVYDGDVIGIELLPGMDSTVDSQTMRLGENMIDITNDDSDEVFSSIIPIGNDGVMLQEKVVDIPEAMEKYGGRILTIKQFSVGTQADLRKMVNKYISVHQNIVPSRFTVTALDLSIFDPSVDKFRIGRTYRLLHPKIGVDTYRKLTCIDFNMVSPQQSSYTFEDVNTLWDVTEVGESAGGYGWNGRYSDIGSAGINEQGEPNDGAATTTEKSKSNSKTSSSSSSSSNEHGLYVMYDKQRNLEISARNLNVKFDKLDAYAKATDGRVTEVKANVDGLSTTVTGIAGDVSNLQIEAGRIELSVGNKADKTAIIELINSGQGGTARIAADRINLEGYVTMDDYTSTKGYVDQMRAGDFTAATIKCLAIQSYGGISIGGPITTQGYQYGSRSMAVDGVQVTRFLGTNDVNFKLSDLPGYDEAIAAARIEGASSVTLSTGAGWMDGKVTVTATSPYVSPKSVNVTLPPIDLTVGDFVNNKANVTVTTPSVGVPLAMDTVDATPIYNAAWEKALDTVTLDPSSDVQMEIGKDIEVKAIGSDRLGFHKTLASITVKSPDPGEAYEQGAKDLWDSLNYSSATWSDGPQPAPGWQNTTVTITSKYGSKQWSHQVRIP